MPFHIHTHMCANFHILKLIIYDDDDGRMHIYIFVVKQNYYNLYNNKKKTN